MRCKKCNFNNNSDSIYCIDCGEKLPKGRVEKGYRTPNDFFKLWLKTIGIFIGIITLISILPDSLFSESSFWGGLFLTVLFIDIGVGVIAFILMFIRLFTYKKTDEAVALDDEDELPKTKKVKKTGNNISSYIDDIDDVIFTPKKKTSSSKGVITLIFIVLFVFVMWLLFSDSSQQPSTNTNDAQVQVDQDYTRYLSMHDSEIAWEGNTQYFNATIRNSSDQFITDVIIRIDFSKDKEGKDKFDTRYYTVDVVPPSGAMTISEPVYLNAPIQNWWWLANIEEASSYGN